MPGAMKHVDGEVVQTSCELGVHPVYDVDGLQEILAKWVGRRVSIIVEEVDE